MCEAHCVPSQSLSHPCNQRGVHPPSRPVCRRPSLLFLGQLQVAYNELRPQAFQLEFVRSPPLPLLRRHSSHHKHHGPKEDISPRSVFALPAGPCQPRIDGRHDHMHRGHEGKCGCTSGGEKDAHTLGFLEEWRGRCSRGLRERWGRLWAGSRRPGHGEMRGRTVHRPHHSRPEIPGGCSP